MDCRMLIIISLIVFIWFGVQVVWWTKIDRLEKQCLKIKRDLAVLRGECARRNIIDE